VQAHVLRSTPALLRGGAKAWPMRELWAAERASDPRQLGGIKVPLRWSVAEADQGSREQLSHILRPPAPQAARALKSAHERISFSHPLYRAVRPGATPDLASHRFLNASECLRGCAPLVPHNPTLLFHAGFAASGSAPHWLSEHALSALAYGRALWVLLPPALATFRLDPAAAAVAREPLPLHALLCVQEPADLLFVPALWGQAVIFLQPHIGLTVLFPDPVDAAPPRDPLA
jgi:hypothetical protein